MSLGTGTRLGVFEIVSPLGAGGMGEVYRARDTHLGREVAIKVLPGAVSQDPERIGRFEREAKLLASLNHPNIASIYGHEQSESTHYLVLELVEGKTLAERLASGAIPPEDAFDIAAKIAEALANAHEKGIVHRDLKPANVKLTPDDDVKVLDFGLAKALAEESPDADVDSSLSPTLTREGTRAGVILGTAAYMSPEQAKGKRVDKRTDIFAFGALLYEMLTGKKAFPGDDVSEILAAVIKLEPDWSALPKDVTPRTRSILKRCLAKNPKTRWRDIGDVKLELEDAKEPVEVSAAAAPGRPWAFLASGLLAGAVLALVSAWTISTEDAGVLYADIGPPPGASFYLPSVTPGPPALSPDGSMVVFTAREADGTTRLYVRSLQRAEARSLPATENAQYPFWSPDSGSIGFYAQGKLRRVQVAGGQPDDLCEALAGKGGAWNEVGDIVFTPGPGTPLFRVPADGGECTPLTNLDRELSVSHRFPQFLPNGRDFLFLARSGEEGRQHAVMAGSLDGGEPVELLRSTAVARYASGYLLFLRERTLVAQRFDPERLVLEGEPVAVAENIRIVSGGTGYAVFSVSPNGRLIYLAGSGGSRLEWVDRHGRHIQHFDEIEDYVHLTLSPDERRAAVGIFDDARSTHDLWVVDLERGGVRSRLTSDSFHENHAIWSPSQDAVVFSSNPTGQFDVFKTMLDRPGEKIPFLDFESFVSPWGWSSDGKLVTLAAEGDIWIYPVDPQGEPYPFLETDYSESTPVLSPDGRWMAYVSTESGQNDVYVTPFPAAGRKVRVSSNSGTIPWWRKDGRELIYRELSGQVVAVAVDGRGDDFIVGESERLFEAEVGYPTYAPTADAQRFLVIRPVDDDRRPMTLVENWTSLLERR